MFQMIMKEYQPLYKEIISTLSNEGRSIKNTGSGYKNMVNKDYWLTKVDENIDKVFQRLVNEIEHSPVILSDQNPLAKGSLNKTESIWIVDPLSHGFSFIRDLPHYAIVISHILKGEVVFAFVYDPSTDESFTAYKGGGAYLNGRKIQVSKRKDKIAILFDYYPLREGINAKNLELYRDLTEIGRVKTFGSYAVNYCYVACGRAEVAVTQNRDTYTEYAGKLIVEESGGTLTDFESNELQPETKGILCTNGDWHAKLEDVLSKYVGIADVVGKYV